MKKLTLIFILFAFNAYALPFCDDDKVSFKSLHIHTTESGKHVFYVYKIEDNDIEQVGLINQAEGKIYKMRGPKKIDKGYGYLGESDYKNYIEKHFPKLSPIILYSE